LNKILKPTNHKLSKINLLGIPAPAPPGYAYARFTLQSSSPLHHESVNNTHLCMLTNLDI